jgi:hypothetical protein
MLCLGPPPVNLEGRLMSLSGPSCAVCECLYVTVLICVQLPHCQHVLVQVGCAMPAWQLWQLTQPTHMHTRLWRADSRHPTSDTDAHLLCQVYQAQIQLVVNHRQGMSSWEHLVQCVPMALYNVMGTEYNVTDTRANNVRPGPCGTAST